MSQQDGSTTPGDSPMGAAESIREAGRTSWAIIGIILVAAAFVGAFVFTRSVSVPIVLAFVLAVVFQPAADWLVKRGMSRGAAAAVTLLGMVVVLIGIAALVAATIVANWDTISGDLSDAASKVDDMLSNTSFSSTLGSEANASGGSSGSTLLTGLGSGVASAFNSVAGLIAGLFFGLWVAFYVLQGNYVRDKSKDPPGARPPSRFTELVEYSETSIRGYYTSQTVLGIFDGTLIALPMVLLGIPGALSVAVVNVVGSYIPYIGAFVGGGLAVLLALAEGGTSMALFMLVVVLLVQNTLENIIQPKVTSKYVSLSPLAVLLATALGGVVAGLVGLIVAVPFAAVAVKAVDLARRPDGVTAATTADASTDATATSTDTADASTDTPAPATDATTASTDTADASTDTPAPATDATTDATGPATDDTS